LNHTHSELGRVRSLEAEVRRLQDENERLWVENRRLKGAQDRRYNNLLFSGESYDLACRTADTLAHLEEDASAVTAVAFDAPVSASGEVSPIPGVAQARERRDLQRFQRKLRRLLDEQEMAWDRTAGVG
jgi:16S rRNA C967 or C1407 C5-methylase (RsmB/RsmF family)